MILIATDNCNNDLVVWPHANAQTDSRVLQPAATFSLSFFKDAIAIVNLIRLVGLPLLRLQHAVDFETQRLIAIDAWIQRLDDADAEADASDTDSIGDSIGESIGGGGGAISRRRGVGSLTLSICTDEAALASPRLPFWVVAMDTSRLGTCVGRMKSTAQTMANVFNHHQSFSNIK